MNRWLVELLCDPGTKEPLELVDAVEAADGSVESGYLVSLSGRRYPIIGGIPRFVRPEFTPSGEAFGDEWNYFNFTDFKSHWLAHTVANTFGDASTFRDKVIVDAGAGSGAQSRWMLEAGAAHVIALELSHSVDGVLKGNLEQSGHQNFDIIQCSIDRPPIRDQVIDGLVICHNVVQHTRSVEGTLHALWSLVGVRGELVFNCYQLNDAGPLRWARFHLVFRPLRGLLRRSSFRTRLWYSRVMAWARFLPILGTFLEKSGFMVRGDVPKVNSGVRHFRQQYRSAVLNTFDAFGSHEYQHYERDEDIRRLIDELGPSEVLNLEKYFRRPQPIGCALRLIRGTSP